MSPMCWLSQAYLLVGDRQGVLQIAADGQRRRHRHRKRHRQRRIAAGAPDGQLRSPSTDPHDGVVARHQDGPVVHQPAVGEVRKPFERIVVGEADRFAAEIAGCHHQYRRSRLVARQPEQQRMQRGVGQHHAEIRVVRRDRSRRRARRPAAASARWAAAGRTATAPTPSSIVRDAVCGRPGRAP